MKRSMLSFVVILICIAPVRGQEPANRRGQVEAYLKKVTLARLAIASNTEEWLNHFPNDVLLTGQNGDIADKAELRKLRAAGAPDLTRFVPPLEDVKFQLSGDVAILNYRVLRVTKYGDQEVRVQIRKNDVFVRRHNRWELISIQQFFIPNTERIGRKLSAEILDRYAGQYESYPPPLHFFVERQGDKLMIRQSDEKDWTELLAASEDTFVIPGVSEQFVFEGNSAGNLTAIVVRVLSGQDYSLKRIK
jgi:hypothetical protein